jgi:polysaccharide export outer membrane protein
MMADLCSKLTQWVRAGVASPLRTAYRSVLIRHKEMRGIRDVAFGIFLAVLLPTFGSVAAFAQNMGLPGPSALQQPAAEASALAPVATPASTATITDENYHLGTGDKLRITVYGEDDLSGEFLVDGSGQVQLPLVGQVKAAGLTIHEFVAKVVTALEDGYLKDPKVSVEVENYRPFYIMGEVNKPGEYPYESGLNVLGAVALAGGYTYRADDGEVYIRRAGATKEEVLPADASTKIYPGDIIRVAERLF